MINILSVSIIIIALAQLWRVWQLVRPESKKRHFELKLKGTEKMIWDLEFKVHKTQEVREDIRKEYDFMNSRIEGFTRQLETAKDEDKPTIEDNITRAPPDRDRLKAQIEQIDVEINGSKKCQQYPDGATGIKHQIDSLRELTTMLKSWIKTL